MKNEEENKTEGFNKETKEPNSNKVSFENGPNLRKKRSRSKRINCAESDTKATPKQELGYPEKNPRIIKLVLLMIYLFKFIQVE